MKRHKKPTRGRRLGKHCDRGGQQQKTLSPNDKGMGNPHSAGESYDEGQKIERERYYPKERHGRDIGGYVGCNP